MIRKLLHFALMIFVVCLFSIAKNLEADVTNLKYCLEEHALGIATGSARISETVPDAEELLRQIGSKLGLDRDISITSCRLIEKVEAWAASPNEITESLRNAGVGPGRYIVYNPIWVREVIGNDRDQAVFVFGHEFGHFLGGHFFEKSGISRVKKELEADRFAGCASARMLAQWPSIENLVSRIRPPSSDGYYPSAREALSQVEVGFKECGGEDSLCRREEYGVESWGYEHLLEKRSNWRGGGGSQPGFCAEAAAELRSKYPNANEFEVANSREQTRDTCSPFRCIEYQYFCTIRVRGDPVFLEGPC